MRAPLSNELIVFTPMRERAATSSCVSPARARSSRSLRTRSTWILLSCVGWVSGGAVQEIAHGPCRNRKQDVALDGETANADAAKLCERGISPLVAVFAKRRKAVAKQLRVIAVELRFGDIERVAASREEKLDDDHSIHAAALLRTKGKARKRRAHVGRE